MKIIYKLSLFFTVLLSASSCNLDLNSTSTIPIDKPEDVFVTYLDAERFAIGLTSYFRSTTYGVFAETSEIQSDMFNASLSFGNNGGAPHTMSNIFTASDYDIVAIWDGYFSSLKGYNYFLENIHFVESNSKLSAAQRSQIKLWKGYAFFYRAYTYMELTKKFCPAYDPNSAVGALGLPLVTKYDIAARPARATLQATVDFVEAQMDSAYKYLASAPGVLRSEYPTSDAVTALRARHALWTQNWQKAAEYADILIKNPTYALADSPEQMTDEWINEIGPESIVQLYSSLTESPRSMSIFVGSYYGIISNQNAYIPNFFPTKRLNSLYEKADIRYNAYITEQVVVAGPGAFMALVFTKFRGNPALTSNKYFANRVKAKIFRIAEMYLIKAEAEVRSGGDAKTTLNILQTARKATPTGGTLLDVQNEWARETAGEGFRIECLKRWGLGFIDREPIDSRLVVTGQGYVKINIPAGTHYFTWPIPTSEILYNKNMVQNTGW